MSSCSVDYSGLFCNLTNPITLTSHSVSIVLYNISARDQSCWASYFPFGVIWVPFLNLDSYQPRPLNNTKRIIIIIIIYLKAGYVSLQHDWGFYNLPPWFRWPWQDKSRFIEVTKLSMPMITPHLRKHSVKKTKKQKEPNSVIKLHVLFES